MDFTDVQTSAMAGELRQEPEEDGDQQGDREQRGRAAGATAARWRCGTGAVVSTAVIAHPFPTAGSSDSRPSLSSCTWSRRSSRLTTPTTWVARASGSPRLSPGQLEDEGDAAAVEHVVALAHEARGGLRDPLEPAHALPVAGDLGGPGRVAGLLEPHLDRLLAVPVGVQPEAGDPVPGVQVVEAPAERQRRPQARHATTAVGTDWAMRMTPLAASRPRPRRRRAARSWRWCRWRTRRGSRDQEASDRDGHGRPHSGDPRRLPMISASASAPATRVATVSTTRRQVQRWIRTGGSR